MESILEGLIEGIFEFLVEVIFKTFFNSIGAAIRWLFFLGRYSYSHLFDQFGRNITLFILTFITLLGSAIYLSKNSKKEIQEQKNNINLSISNHE
ncbi:hypothetical protein WAF17_19735 [Bernardetia sp. ABR2-2B]|uniref:hypothetical protein n=1 Tax=Bernardetia sp. ABR2-2B TaxID=3127472 RepID=UPI0030D49B2A